MLASFSKVEFWLRRRKASSFRRVRDRGRRLTSKEAKNLPRPRSWHPMLTSHSALRDSKCRVCHRYFSFYCLLIASSLRLCFPTWPYPLLSPSGRSSTAPGTRCTRGRGSHRQFPNDYQPSPYSTFHNIPQIRKSCRAWSTNVQQRGLTFMDVDFFSAILSGVVVAPFQRLSLGTFPPTLCVARHPTHSWQISSLIPYTNYIPTSRVS